LKIKEIRDFCLKIIGQKGQKNDLNVQFAIDDMASFQKNGPLWLTEKDKSFIM
jgi:hypothetical protein